MDSVEFATLNPFLCMCCFFFVSTEEYREEYKNVDTLLFFVGYSRSRHTLLASLLDGHPHMIVANENNMFYRLVRGTMMERNDMFDALVRGSQGFMKGGKGMVMDGNLQNTSHFGFFMEGYWQGTYDKYIKVRLHKLWYKYVVYGLHMKSVCVRQCMRLLQVLIF